MTLTSLKLRIFAHRLIVKRFIRKLAGFYIIASLIFLIVGTFLIFHPEAGKDMAGKLPPIPIIIQLVIALIVYRLAGKIRA